MVDPYSLFPILRSPAPVGWAGDVTEKETPVSEDRGVHLGISVTAASWGTWRTGNLVLFNSPFTVQAWNRASEMFVQQWEDEPGFLPLRISQAALEISQISQVLASLLTFSLTCLPDPCPSTLSAPHTWAGWEGKMNRTVAPYGQIYPRQQLNKSVLPSPRAWQSLPHSPPSWEESRWEHSHFIQT